MRARLTSHRRAGQRDYSAARAEPRRRRPATAFSPLVTAQQQQAQQPLIFSQAATRQHMRTSNAGQVGASLRYILRRRLMVSIAMTMPDDAISQ